MLRLEVTRQALRFLDRLPPKQYRQVMRKVISLMADPAPPDSKMLKGTPARAASAGEYRVIYQVVPGALRVIDIGKRNDDEVYRRLR